MPRFSISFTVRPKRVVSLCSTRTATRCTTSTSSSLLASSSAVFSPSLPLEYKFGSSSDSYSDSYSS